LRTERSVLRVGEQVSLVAELENRTDDTVVLPPFHPWRSCYEEPLPPPPEVYTKSTVHIEPWREDMESPPGIETWPEWSVIASKGRAAYPFNLADVWSGVVAFPPGEYTIWVDYNAFTTRPKRGS
jgi:hypothetical protein